MQKQVRMRGPKYAYADEGIFQNNLPTILHKPSFNIC